MGADAEEAHDAVDAPAEQWSEPRYAGFWIRLGAYLIDMVVLAAVFVPLGIILFAAGASSDDLLVPVDGSPRTDLSGETESLVVHPGLILSAALVSLLYFTLMESGKGQGTLGKLMLGLKVVDTHGRRISFGRAVGRQFSALLSSILYIGYIMIGLDRHKRALHDRIAETYVVYRKPAN